MSHDHIQVENVASWLLFGERVVSEGAPGWRNYYFGFRADHITFNDLVAALIDGSIVPTEAELEGFADE